ncbi:MAG: hypothetical protein ACYDDR_12350, partial [Acidithiobacillus ferrivorans]
CKKRLTSDHKVVMGEMPVVCKKWLTGVILNICRSVQNRVEQAVEARRSILCLVVNHPRPANANDRVAAGAVVHIQIGNG